MTKAKVSQQKRSRERAKQEKRQQKAERRAQSTTKPGVKRLPGDEDPDLAGIVPGPQPSPWGDDDLEDEKTEP
jgi:hypothetical protein